MYDVTEEDSFYDDEFYQAVFELDNDIVYHYDSVSELYDDLVYGSETKNNDILC